MTLRIILWVALLGMNSQATAPEPLSLDTLDLELPVRCSMQTDCLVQKLVDVDGSPARADYHCGTLTTDAHDGTDIRVRTLADMKKGVAVLAAANGRVLRVRDGEPDESVHERSDFHGRDAGNAIVIDHGNGWQTQYSHLRNGSVLVRPGMAVGVGEQLGFVGMSGNAEFPHLHFTVRHLGKSIDPFTGLAPPSHCSLEKREGAIWSATAARNLAYHPTAIISVGFSSAAPALSLADRELSIAPSTTATSLVLWADVLGVLPGDTQTFEIRGPNGELILDRSTLVKSGGVSWLAYAGKKAPSEGWSKGNVTGRYELKRSGTTVDVRAARLKIG